MTNKDKYLKDGVDVCDLIRKIANYKPKLETSDNVYAIIQEFFASEVKPTLTEDEKVILRNIKEPYKWIRRTSSGELQIGSEELERSQWIITLSCYPHLFQFIQPRRRI